MAWDPPNGSFSLARWTGTIYIRRDLLSSSSSSFIAAEFQVNRGAKMTAEEAGEAAPEVEEKEERSEPGAIQKSSSFVEERGSISDLNPHEKKAFVELRAKLEETMDSSASLWGVPLRPSEGSDKTDVVLLKFLRAREFKAKESFEMIRNTLQWRKEQGIDSILEEELGEGMEAAAYVDGVDREGHPVCYNDYGVFHDSAAYEKAFGSEESVEKFLRWRFQMMEKEIRRLDFRPGGVSSILQISDLKKSPGFYRKELRHAMHKALALLQDNYPEFVAKNIVINAPFWYYALNAILSPFLTQRSKNKFVVVRPSKVTETLLKYISADAIPVRYGGLRRENDEEFSAADECGVSEIVVKPGSIESIEIPVPEIGMTAVWDVVVLGWEVNYKEEFVPSDEGSYTILLQKGKKMAAEEAAIRNSFKNSEAGKVVLMIENASSVKKKALYRSKLKKA
ncbi:sec14p-like phosphatidylinositol transfer family protein [Wolffia australiana]